MDVTMPQLGETVTEGTITKWLKAVGEPVALDEPLFEVSTDKVDSEVPSPVAGVLTEIVVPEGDTVDVGARLAVIGGAGDEAAAVADEPTPASAPPPPPGVRFVAPVPLRFMTQMSLLPSLLLTKTTLFLHNLGWPSSYRSSGSWAMAVRLT